MSPLIATLRAARERVLQRFMLDGVTGHFQDRGWSAFLT
jgi:hypothetical protein